MITPNTIIQIIDQYSSYYTLPTQLEAEMVEVPPHFRTLKIQIPYSKSHHYFYSNIPYTQFYITKHKIRLQGSWTYAPIVFISNSLKSKPKSPLKYSFSNCSFILGGCICWGNGWRKPPTEKNEIISHFWNSSFDHNPFPSSADFKILE